MSNPSIIEQAIGYGANYQLTVKDSTGAVVTQYTNANALLGKVWTGQDQTPIITPTVTWIDPTAGTVNLALTSTNMNALGGPGQYRIQCWVIDNGGEPHIFFDGGLSATDSPGTATAPGTDITYEQLALFVPQIADLKDYDINLTGFADERHEAQQWFQQKVLNLYRPQLGRSRRYVSADGTTAGSILKYAPSPMGSWDPPTLEDLQDYFDAGGLVISENVAKCQALYAASVIYLGQPGRDNIYQQAGMAKQVEAERMFPTVITEIDTGTPPTSPPTPIIRVDRDVTYLT